MRTDSPNPILIVEDSVVTSIAASRIIEQALPEHQIIRAQTCLEARILLKIYPFSVIIVDVHLPDGCGLDLIPEILEKRPMAGVITMTADDSPENRFRSDKLGVHHFITKPIKPEALRHATLTSLANAANPSPSQGFRAKLIQVSLFDIVQLKCLNRASCRLEVSYANPNLLIGSIDFKDGEIIHAEVCDAELHKTAAGEAALEQVLVWKKGSIEESELPSTSRRTVFESTQDLLLNAAQRTDETNATCEPQEMQSGQPTLNYCRDSSSLPLQPTSGISVLPLERCSA